jgi:hypothetical protein
MKNIISSSEYLKTTQDIDSLKNLMAIYNNNIKPDGVRNRAYLKLIWNREYDSIIVAKNQNYFQSANSNVMDGGKVRQFAVMDSKILELSIMQNVFNKNLSIMKGIDELMEHKELVIGLHFIQYKTNQFGASYSSPVWLHIDDEPLVFVHLLNLTPNALGGDNLIADLSTKEITHVARLEQPFETLMLTREYYHAVTPLGAREGEARRDILLFTVEPTVTQVERAA